MQGIMSPGPSNVTDVKTTYGTSDLVTKPNSQSQRPSAPDFSKYDVRRSTYAKYPDYAPVKPDKLAQAGFYYIGDGFAVKCFSCKTVISEWKHSDIAIDKHRHMAPYCEFLKTLSKSELPNESQEFVQLMKDENERIKTFENWPHSTPSAKDMVKAGFYFLQVSDKVRCPFCKGVISKWDPVDIPIYEHAKHFPNCAFILENSRDECGFQTAYSVPEKQSSLAMKACIETKGNAKINDLTNFISTHTPPKHTSMVSIDARLKSFESWPLSSPKPADLADAGFFYIQLQDYAKCYHCDGGLCNWEKDDDPWKEHARWFPRCEFVQAKKGQEFIEASRKEHQQVMTQLAHTAESETPKQQAVEEGCLPENLKSELEAMMQAEDVQFYVKNKRIDEKIIRATLKQWMLTKKRGFESVKDIGPVLSKAFSLVKPAEASTSGTQSTAATSSAAAKCEATSDRVLCRVCMNDDVGMVFLPCGHLATCPSCAVSLEICPICRTTIMGTVRTYLT